MSYENTKCPCGGSKQRETMICQACTDHLSGTNPHEIKGYQDSANHSAESRRNMAIRLLAAARRRKPRLALSFTE
jgi:hypothetical protein